MGKCKFSGGLNPPVVGNTLPPRGPENSRSTLIDILGQLIRWRWFGPDGRAIHDRDFTDHNRPDLHPEVPHDHRWDWDEDDPRQGWESIDEENFC